jgi:DNA-binding CsgD family transcriptional regulator
MHERLRSVIPNIYAAAADESRWLPALERIGDAFGGDVSGLQRRTGQVAQVRWGRFAHLDPALATRIVREFADRNPWVRAMQPLWRPGMVIASHAVVPVSHLRRTAYYDGILQPAHLEHAMGACLFRAGDDVLNFTLVRSGARGPYGRQEMNRVRTLIPHLQRAVQVGMRLAELEKTRTALADGLERLQYGVFIVAGSGRVVFANRAARNVAGQRDGLSIARDGLTAAAPTDRLALRSLVDEAVRTSKGEGEGPGGAMRVSRPSMKRPYNVLVAPLPLEAEIGAAGLATVFVSDPELAPRTSEEIARRLYGLSSAEARLAKALVETGSVERAADTLRITPGTTRWHLKRIYRKTGAHHQAALVGKLLRGTSRLATEDA